MERNNNTFGFIAHTMELNNLKKFAPALIKKPLAQLKTVLETLPVKEFCRIKLTSSSTGRKVEGILVTTWLLPEQYLELPANRVTKRILDAARILEREGAYLVGLGGYNSIVPAGAGRIIAKNCKTAVTNGNTLTILSAVNGINKALEELNRQKEEQTITIVGASGSIGSVITTIIARDSYKKIIICARNLKRLEAKAKNIFEKTGVTLYPVTDVKEAVSQSDIVISATSTPGRVFQPEDFKSGAIVCDVAMPHDVSDEISEKRKDLFCFEGGLILMPEGYSSNPDFSKIMQLPPHVSFACLAETALLALEGIQEHFSLDSIKVENVDYLAELSVKHGFVTAPFKNSQGFIDAAAFRRGAIITQL